MVIYVLCGKSTPAGKKYTSAAGGAGDKLQLWLGDAIAIASTKTN